MNCKIKLILPLLIIAGFILALIPIENYIGSNEAAQQLALLNITPNWAYSQLETPVLVPPNLESNGFEFDVQVMNYSPFMQDVVNQSVIKYGLGSTTPYWISGELGEWGYSFFNLKNGALDGSGRAWYGGYPTPPAN